ncbi:MAG: zinc ribbon domain-containing protein [Clostridia bacterium]
MRRIRLCIYKEACTNDACKENPMRKYKKALKLSDRTYICAEGGNVIDRDYQASVNLKQYGINQLSA